MGTDLCGGHLHFLATACKGPGMLRYEHLKALTVVVAVRNCAVRIRNTQLAALGIALDHHHA